MPLVPACTCTSGTAWESHMPRYSLPGILLLAGATSVNHAQQQSDARPPDPLRVEQTFSGGLDRSLIAHGSPYPFDKRQTVEVSKHGDRQIRCNCPDEGEVQAWALQRPPLPPGLSVSVSSDNAMTSTPSLRWEANSPPDVGEAHKLRGPTHLSATLPLHAAPCPTGSKPAGAPCVR